MLMPCRLRRGRVAAGALRSPPMRVGLGACSAAVLVLLGGCQCNDTAKRARATIELSPGSVDFGILAPGESASAEITLRNAGRAELAISSVAIEGDGRASFHLVEQPRSLTVGESVVLHLTYAPSSEGI